MGYVVIEGFCDMGDNDRAYSVGDVYPRRGLSVSEGRLKTLATSANALGRPLIKAEKAEKAEKVEIVAVEPLSESKQEIEKPKRKSRKKD